MEYITRTSMDRSADMDRTIGQRTKYQALTEPKKDVLIHTPFK
jgi:hypothetical protein